MKTLFEKIVAREIPATIVYEDDLVVAFRDTKPQAPTHVLIVPKKPIPRIAEAAPEDHKILGHLLLKAAEVAKNAGSGYRAYTALMLMTRPPPRSRMWGTAARVHRMIEKTLTS